MWGLAGHSPARLEVPGVPEVASSWNPLVVHSWWAGQVLGPRHLGVEMAPAACLLGAMLGVWPGPPGKTGAGLAPLHLLLQVAAASLITAENVTNLS